MTASVKHLVVRLFNAFGLDIRRRRPATPERASMAGGLAQLARLGFQPRTVIDAGVASATPELYSTFPSASILLIEPLAEFEPFLQKICSGYNAQYVLAAAGQAPGSATLNVHADKVGSSLLREVEGASVDGTPRTVPVVTIDQQCAERKLLGPYLIKVDVQGAELQILAGATRTLQKTEAVIIEVTFFGTMIGGPQFYDIVHFMKQCGFVAYDIFGVNYRPLDGALAQVDMIFVREDGPFRRSHAFATPEQREASTREMKAQFAEQAKKLS
ncbi:MAG: FkbM family methyltransferase [Acidobacteria bacterium]|nr:MAG: FkbM family methyltransferase [Acidobacteriota bacterium]